MYTFCLSSCSTDLAREKWARVHCQNFWVERRELLPLSDDENFCHFQKYIILEAILDCKMNKTIFQSILICARQKKNTIYGKMSALLRARKMSAPLGRWFYVKFSWEIFSVCSFLCTEQIRRFVETFARRQLIFWWALIICDRSLLGRWFFVPAHFLFLL